jgi:hypothetical protein
MAKEKIEITIGRYLYWNKLQPEEAAHVIELLSAVNKLSKKEQDLHLMLTETKMLNYAAIREQGTELVVVDPKGDYGVTEDRFTYVNALAEKFSVLNEKQKKFFDFLININCNVVEKKKVKA